MRKSPTASRPPGSTPRRPALRRIAAIAGAASVLTALLAAGFLQWRYGLILAGPRADPGAATARAGVVAMVDPAKLAELVREEARESTGWSIPSWAVRRMLPNSGGVAGVLDLERRRVDVRVFANPNTLLPVVRRMGDTLRFTETFPAIRWKRGVEEPVRGLVVKEGVVAFAADAEEAFWYTWNQSLPPSPPAFEGGHLLEVNFDNRQGHAFLVVASILEAYDIELGTKETDITLSSLQFVRDARMTVDLADADTFRVRLVLEILPEEIEKLGVVNLKVGLEELFTKTAARWKREHGLQLEGQSAWDDTRIVFDYRLTSAKKAFHLLLNGKLD